MEKQRLILLSLLFSFLISGMPTMIAQQNRNINSNETVYRGKYLGLKAPDADPEVFAPGFFQQENYYPHGTIAFSPDGDEIFWGVIVRGEKPGFEIMTARLENGIWSKPEKAKFLGQYWGLCPVFSGDGRRLYFHSNKPQAGIVSKVGSTFIYYTEKVGGKWIEPKFSPVNSGNELSLTQSANGNIYYASISNSTKGLMDFDLYKCRLNDHNIPDEEILGNKINSEFQDFFPYISPDDSILLFSSDRSGAGDPYKQRLYISFKTKDGWGTAIDLSEALGLKTGQDGFPSLSPDGKYLFFHSTRYEKEGSYYWSNFEKLLKRLND